MPLAINYKLPGRCYRANLAAAVSIARLFNIDDSAIADCLDSFKALPHRLEFAAEKNGVSYYNDSKATTPEAAIAAIEAFGSPVILIAGGYDKKLDFDEMAKVISAKVKDVFLIGDTARSIAEAIDKTDSKTKPDVARCDSLAKAVHLAADTAAAGDVVILSPACASYDMFENYEQRGNLFKSLVNKL